MSAVRRMASSAVGVAPTIIWVDWPAGAKDGGAGRAGLREGWDEVSREEVKGAKEEGTAVGEAGGGNEELGIAAG